MTKGERELKTREEAGGWDKKTSRRVKSWEIEREGFSWGGVRGVVVWQEKVGRCVKGRTAGLGKMGGKGDKNTELRNRLKGMEGQLSCSAENGDVHQERNQGEGGETGIQKLMAKKRASPESM